MSTQTPASYPRTSHPQYQQHHVAHNIGGVQLPGGGHRQHVSHSSPFTTRPQSQTQSHSGHQQTPSAPHVRHATGADGAVDVDGESLNEDGDKEGDEYDDDEEKEVQNALQQHIGTSQQGHGQFQTPGMPEKRKRGRPKGSRNKNKRTSETTPGGVDDSYEPELKRARTIDPSLAPVAPPRDGSAFSLSNFTDHYLSAPHHTLTGVNGHFLQTKEVAELGKPRIAHSAVLAQLNTTPPATTLPGVLQNVPEAVTGPFIFAPPQSTSAELDADGPPPATLTGPVDPSIIPPQTMIAVYYVVYRTPAPSAAKPSTIAVRPSAPSRTVKSDPDAAKRQRGPRKCAVCSSYTCKGRGGRQFCTSGAQAEDGEGSPTLVGGTGSGGDGDHSPIANGPFTIRADDHAGSTSTVNNGPSTSGSYQTFSLTGLDSTTNGSGSQDIQVQPDNRWTNTTASTYPFGSQSLYSGEASSSTGRTAVTSNAAASVPPGLIQHVTSSLSFHQTPRGKSSGAEGAVSGSGAGSGSGSGHRAPRHCKNCRSQTCPGRGGVRFCKNAPVPDGEA